MTSTYQALWITFPQIYPEPKLVLLVALCLGVTHYLVFSSYPVDISRINE